MEAQETIAPLNFFYQYPLDFFNQYINSTLFNSNILI